MMQFPRLLLLVILALLSACVSVQVDPLTSKAFEPRPGKDAVTTLQREPNGGHVQIARTVTSRQTRI